VLALRDVRQLLDVLLQRGQGYRSLCIVHPGVDFC
jgi:hypothetical protein